VAAERLRGGAHGRRGAGLVVATAFGRPTEPRERGPADEQGAEDVPPFPESMARGDDGEIRSAEKAA